MALLEYIPNLPDESSDHRRLLPHELLFSLFLLLTWLRLVIHVGVFSTTTMVYLASIVLNFLMVFWVNRHPTALRWRIRLLMYPILMCVLYAHLRYVVPLIHPHGEDHLLQSIDHYLVGGNLSLELQPSITPWLTETMNICYLLLIPYLFLSLTKYLFAPLALAKKFYIGLFSLYGLGLLSYTFVPALGPYLSMANQFHQPLQGYTVTHLITQVYPKLTNYVDVFPSLHCAISAYLLLFDRAHAKWRYRLYLLPCIGLWVSTLYLRYHYFIDVISGFALAALSLYIAKHYYKPASTSVRSAVPRVKTQREALTVD